MSEEATWLVIGVVAFAMGVASMAFVGFVTSRSKPWPTVDRKRSRGRK